MKTILLAFIIFSSSAFGQTKSFDEIWASVFEKSYEQKSALQEKEASELSLNRAKRHWLPRVYTMGQYLNTNDPTQVFFNNLGQRSITQTDFSPALLNNPDRQKFKMGTLGVDLPLFEGGFKSSQSSMYESLVKSAELQMKAKKSEEYAELGRQYGGLLLHTQNEGLLKDLKIGLEKIISSYQVGSSSNPVGYSGLLGLKGVDHRIEGLLAEYEMKIHNSKNWINTKIESEENWVPNLKQSIQNFLSDNLSSSSTNSYSTMLLAQEMKLKTLDDVKDMERARYLPRVGLFAQNNVYSGDRNTGYSQAYGLYLMWDIFNSDSYGRMGEAQAKAMAEKSKLESHKQQEKIMLNQLLESKATLEKNIVLLNKTEILLKEQTQNAMKLFKAGMLNALQLAEVINRRVDLIQNKDTAENQYLEVYSRLYQLNN
ncbi:MAG: TolC family protein [Bacteriovoracaceae bacterium]